MAEIIHGEFLNPPEQLWAPVATPPIVTRYLVSDLPIRHTMAHGATVDIEKQPQLVGIHAIEIVETGQTINLRAVREFNGAELVRPIPIDHDRPADGQRIVLG